MAAPCCDFTLPLNVHPGHLYLRFADSDYERRRIAELVYESSRLQNQNCSYREGLTSRTGRACCSDPERIAEHDREIALGALHLVVLWSDEDQADVARVSSELAGSVFTEASIAMLMSPIEIPMMREALAQRLDLDGYPQAVLAISAD